MATRRKPTMKCKPTPKRRPAHHVSEVERRLARIERAILSERQSINNVAAALAVITSALSTIVDAVEALQASVDELKPGKAVALRLIPGPVTEQRSNRA